MLPCANYLQTLLSSDAQYEVVPFLGAALVSKHLLIESAADGTDGAHVATQHSGDVLGGDAKFDEEVRLILQFGHRVEVA